MGTSCRVASLFNESNYRHVLRNGKTGRIASLRPSYIHICTLALQLVVVDPPLLRQAQVLPVAALLHQPGCLRVVRRVRKAQPPNIRVRHAVEQQELFRCRRQWVHGADAHADHDEDDHQHGVRERELLSGIEPLDLPARVERVESEPACVGCHEHDERVREHLVVARVLKCVRVVLEGWG